MSEHPSVLQGTHCSCTAEPESGDLGADWHAIDDATVAYG